MKKLATILVLVLLCFATDTFAQRSFIETYARFLPNAPLIEGRPHNNSQFVRLKSKGDTIYLYPNDVISYGFKNGKVFYSRRIELKGETLRVFVENILPGEINLYYYVDKEQRAYYLEKGTSGLVEIPFDAKARLDTLNKYVGDYPWMKDPIRQTRYSRSSLNRLVTLYNRGRNRPLSYFKWGVNAGLINTTIGVPIPGRADPLAGLPRNSRFPLLATADFSPANTVFVGLFADDPIKNSSFSYHYGIGISKSFLESTHSRFITDINSRRFSSEINAEIELITLDFPFMIRYTLPERRLRPFINLGMNMSYHIRNHYRIEEFRPDTGNTIVTNQVNGPQLVSIDMFGWIFGGGVQYQLKSRHNLTFEVRRNDFFEEKDRLNKRQILFVFGVSL
ncbi:MAG: outer membrane beta-barrel protein [Cytophagales bacterium]|nr:outer membrane beta-barrel protein [Cytophagales bacterium]